MRNSKKQKLGQASGQNQNQRTTQNKALMKQETNLFVDGHLNVDFGMFSKRTEKNTHTSKSNLSHQAPKKEELQDIPELMRLDNIKLGSSQKIMIKDVEVLFPFVPYEAQIDYMTKVIEALNGSKNALLQSPTGTGKTLCLLCATLAWIQKYKTISTNNFGQQEYKPIKIYYSTRTHSQIKQVIKELKQTCYRPVMSILGSRNQLCVKSDFSELSGFQLNSACKAARTSNIPEHRCQYYDTLNKNKTLIMNQNKNLLYDIEELANIGKKSRFCPYFLQKDVQTNAELIFLPYNYLLDAKIRETSEIDLTNSIVIFDEAHNLESNAEESCSFDLSLRTLENCELDFKLLRQKLRQTPEECKISEYEISILEYPITSLYMNMAQMKTSFEKDFRQSSRSEESQQKGRVCAGRDIFDIFEGMTYQKSTQNLQADRENSFKNGITAGNFDAFVKLLKQAVDELTSVPTSKGGLEHMFQCSSFVYDLLKIDIQSKAQIQTEWSHNFIESYMLYVHFNEDDYSDFHFSLWCLNPGVGFSFLKQQKPLSVILTSGTLTPFKSFESELQLEFPIQLVNKHVIDTKNQCYTVVLRKGPANCPLNFSYEKREDTSIYNEMGTTLINIARLVPNGILVVFASYSLMHKCFEVWQSTDQRILKRLEELKPVYREPKKSSQLKTVMNQYLKDAKTKGAILCCVCRGKVSEGIDFADEMARAVVMVGIPFPPIGDIKIKHKKKFLDDNKAKTKRITGSDWYLHQTTRAFNQAIGRVIRHINDYGVVFLCDERYSGDQFKNEYPNWIKDNLEIVDKFGFMVGKVASFFKDKSRAMTSIAKLISKPNLNTQASSTTMNSEFSMSFDQESSRNNVLLERPAVQNNIKKEPSVTFSSILQTKDLKRKFEQPTPSAFEPPSTFGVISPTNQIQSDSSHYLNVSRPEKTNHLDPGSPRSFKEIIDRKNALLKKESPYNGSGIKRIKKEEECRDGKISALEEDLFPEEIIPKSNNPMSDNNKKETSQFKFPSETFMSIENNFENLSPEDLQSKQTNQQPSKHRHPDSLNRLFSFNSTESSEFQNFDSTNQAFKNQGSFESLTPENSNKVSPDNNQNQGQGHGNQGIECIICYERGPNRNMMASKCGHIACAACWEKWLSIKFECPACKAKVRTKQLIKLHI